MSLLDIVNTLYQFSVPSVLFSRLEYEQKRDMASRLAKLEASLNELNSALNQVEVKEGEVKSITEQVTHEIDQWKEEVHGMVG